MKLIDGEMKPKNQPFSRALRNAFTGMRKFFLSERNGRIQLIVAALAVLLSFLLSINTIEWIIVLSCCGIVLAFEMINTAIEKVCDRITTEMDERIKIIKDLSAAAVLLVSILAIIIGIIIFSPYLLIIFTSN